MLQWIDFRRELSQFFRIVVTGPQRSGTQLCARIIAQETGFTFVPHTGSNGNARGATHIFTSRNKVFHAPGMAAHLTIITQRATAIVWVHRPVEEIRASMRRIKWHGAWRERLALGISPLNSTADTIEPRQYRWRLWCQHNVIHSPFDVEYHSLEGHSLWVPNEERTDWHSSRWE